MGNNPYNNHNYWVVKKIDSSVLEGFTTKEEALKGLKKWKKDYSCKIISYDPLFKKAKRKAKDYSNMHSLTSDQSMIWACNSRLWFIVYDFSWDHVFICNGWYTESPIIYDNLKVASENPFLLPSYIKDKFKQLAQSGRITNKMKIDKSNNLIVDHN